MKSVFGIALLAASASAFAPQQSTPSKSALSMSFESELGAQKPLGFWDPLNVCDGIDQERFDRLRYVEIKHGRIAQLAIVGHMVTTAGFRFGAYEDITANGYGALQQLSSERFWEIIGTVGILEFFIMKDNGAGEFPGDLRNGLFAWKGTDEELMQKRAIELNNGRAAQMGILGLMMHEQLGIDPYVTNAFLGYSSGFSS
ncbi:chloroplastic [Seminavis robusta]|uniref:Chloroplastic n=1 Tax=Seminavis robusta TaxID=568900 RepID=A0A9N8EHY6_9STRA|nr:chloroplastic [Seminavis robusta]|eukprot:Sro1021_g232260.1 chloroplastic (200) ;mRNA; r:21327-22011